MKIDELKINTAQIIEDDIKKITKLENLKSMTNTASGLGDQFSFCWDEKIDFQLLKQKIYGSKNEKENENGNGNGNGHGKKSKFSVQDSEILKFIIENNYNFNFNIKSNKSNFSDSNSSGSSNGNSNINGNINSNSMNMKDSNNTISTTISHSKLNKPYYLIFGKFGTVVKTKDISPILKNNEIWQYLK